MSQSERLLELLRRRGEAGVTPLLALDQVGTFRLAARIWDLRAAGHDISTRTERTPGGAEVACYVLHEANADQLGLGF